VSSAAEPVALVTGATGFLGLHLVDALLAARWRVRALCRATADTTRLEALGVDIARGDVLDRPSLDAAVAPGVAAIFHAAADLSVWRPNDARQTQINVQGTANVVGAALHAARARPQGPRVIHISTIAAYGEQSAPITERTSSTAASSWINYERSKWLAEQEIHKGGAQGLAAMIVAPSAVVGPRDRAGWAKLFVEISRGQVPFCPPGSGTFNDVRAVAAALVACATRGREGETYLLSGETLSFAALIQFVAGELGVPAPRITLPRGVLRPMIALNDWLSTRRSVEPPMTREMAALLCRHTRCGSQKAEQELGYRPAPIETALRDSLSWLREAGLLGEARRRKQ
jgi:dihydroflavonol-4-reductase